VPPITSSESNEELVTALQTNGILKDESLAQVLRLVDRGFFTPSEVGDSAYRDNPVRIGNLHLSAPHMYATALESLEMGLGLSFLNIGSGTGYMSTVMALLAGKNAVHHAIEVHQNMYEYSIERSKAFASSCDTGEHGIAHVEFCHGNVFDLDLGATIKYDRIYIGAGCPANYQNHLADLLATGGILVGPFDDELLKIQRLTDDLDGFTVERIAGVCFAPLVRSPCPAQPPSLRLPVPLWHPANHLSFPPSFRVAVRAILLAFHRSESPLSLLPKHLIPEVLSYASRDWFVPTLSEMDCLKFRLNREVAARRVAEDRANTAVRLQVEAERQREMYQFLCHRLADALRRVGGVAALAAIHPFAAVFGLDIGLHPGDEEDNAMEDEGEDDETEDDEDENENDDSDDSGVEDDGEAEEIHEAA